MLPHGTVGNVAACHHPALSATLLRVTEWCLMSPALSGCSPWWRREADDPLAPLLFEIASGTLYLSVVSRLIGIIYTTAVPSRAVGAMIVSCAG